MKMGLFFGGVLAACLIASSSFGQNSRKDETLQRAPTSAPAEGATTPGRVVIRQGSDAAAGTPTRAIQELEDKSQKYHTGETLSAQEKEENAELKREIVNGTFDIRELSRLALDKHWGARTQAEQNQFVNLMTQLLEKKGILSKEQSQTRGKKYMIKYLGDTYLDPAKSRAKTKTSIHVPKEDVNISIDYKLVKAGPGWKIFDVIVDDARLVDNYKYQFNSIITKS